MVAVKQNLVLSGRWVSCGWEALDVLKLKKGRVGFCSLVTHDDQIYLTCVAPVPDNAG